jgi:hypothetical protein
MHSGVNSRCCRACGPCLTHRPEAPRQRPDFLKRGWRAAPLSPKPEARSAPAETPATRRKAITPLVNQHASAPGDMRVKVQECCLSTVAGAVRSRSRGIWHLPLVHLSSEDVGHEDASHQAKAAARSSVLPEVPRCSVALVYLPEARRRVGPDRVVPPCVTLPSPRRSPAPVAALRSQAGLRA